MQHAEPATDSCDRNYASTIVGSVFLLAAVIWFCYGRTRYTGPLDFVAVEGVRVARSQGLEAGK